ncbi:MAG: hypothetical protein ABJN62_07120 [Halioglobus sp.]
MQDADLLTVFSELALGVAGFSGVIVALGQKQSAWQLLDKLRVSFLLFNALIVVIFSLLPLGLASANMDTTYIWLYSSLLFVLMFAHMPFSFRIFVKSANKYDGFKSAKLHYLNMGIQIVAVVLLLLNVSYFREAWPHVLSLGLILLLTFIVFFELLIISMGQRGDSK